MKLSLRHFLIISMVLGAFLLPMAWQLGGIASSRDRLAAEARSLERERAMRWSRKGPALVQQRIRLYRIKLKAIRDEVHKSNGDLSPRRREFLRAVEWEHVQNIAAANAELRQIRRRP